MSDPAVAAVRRFTRFYTRRMGVLRERLLDSPFSLTEARLIYEIAHHGTTSATELGRELELDAGYLSRILKRFEKRGLIIRTPSPEDGRRALISLSETGAEAFGALNRGSAQEVGDMLAPLSPADRQRLTEAVTMVERLLGEQRPRPTFVLRGHRPGDIGMVTSRHAALYAEEYGWDESFELLVAEILVKFVRDFDPARERAWIAERDGGFAGSVFLVEDSDTTARLRLLLVEPSARGSGLGAALIDECIRFARSKGYQKLTLWTNDPLTGARRLYERAGFTLVREWPHTSFGKVMRGQDWDLVL